VDLSRAASETVFPAVAVPAWPLAETKHDPDQMTSTTTPAGMKDVTVELDVPGHHPDHPEKSKVHASREMSTMPLCLALVFMVAVAGSALGLAINLNRRMNDMEGELNRVKATGVVMSTSAAPLDGYGVATKLVHAGEWASGVHMPSERSDLHSVFCNGTIVLLGGLSLNNTVVATVWKFDPVRETYSEAARPMPTPRFRFGAACMDDKIYVAGGFADRATGDSGASLSSMDVYDVAADTWASGPELAVPRGDLAMAAVDGKLYAIGGYDHNYNAMATNEVLQPGATAWATAAPMPTAKGDLQAAVLGSKVYVPGGWNPEKTFLDEMAVFDVVANSWSLAATPMKAPRGDAAVVALNGRLFVIGGEMWSGKQSTCDWGWGPEPCAVNLIPMHGVEMFSPEDATWTAMSPLPASRFRFAAAAVEGQATNGLGDGVIFSFGGHEHGEVAVNTQWNFHHVPQPTIYFHSRATA